MGIGFSNVTISFGLSSMITSNTIELLAGLSLTKRGLKEGSPVRPHNYRGKGNTYDFGNGPHAKIPKRD